MRSTDECCISKYFCDAEIQTRLALPENIRARTFLGIDAEFPS